ncbi:Fic family protein [Marinobacter sp. NP-4(2019)]|uniref:Fic family protein n=1 Tax=Marinobacter sp. NP-4(2019) TaxID=2488665 RepID=UPI001D1836A7|nr:Fic family protein [Marinobacter sp. NP-4(2019)]
MAATSIMDLAPFIPGEQALRKSALPDKAMELNRISAKLAGRLSPESAETLRLHMAVINSYYSNLIEGNRTQPHEIRQAQKGHYSDDPVKRDLQRESLAHIEVQRWLYAKAPELDEIYSPEFMLELHQRFYAQVPDSLREVRDHKGTLLEQVTPGQWRQRDVEIGRHVPPAHQALPELMPRFCEEYHPKKYRGDHKLIAIAAAHHRFLWIHPFLDGNGRVIRLWTDAALKATGLESYGVWCLSRGLARSAETYKAALARADYPRQGNSDGRGYLSQAGLMEFCEYVLNTALDQANYISELLALNKLRERIDRYVVARNDKRVPGVDAELKPTASLVLFNAFIQGSLDRKQAIALTGMHERSARRLLNQMKQEGLLSETSNRSPLKWEIPEHAEPWYFPQLAPGM